MPRTSRSRKTSHPHISQIRKTSLPRTTRSSLFPLIIIHVRRYGESSRGPYHPWGRACDRVCVSYCLGRRGAPSWADMQEDRKTGRQGGQPDTLSGTGRTQAAPDLASLAPTAHQPRHPSYPAPFPALPAYPSYPAPFPSIPTCVILSTQASHAHPSKRHFVKPFYYFPIYQNVTH